MKKIEKNSNIDAWIGSFLWIFDCYQFKSYTCTNIRISLSSYGGPLSLSSIPFPHSSTLFFFVQTSICVHHCTLRAPNGIAWLAAEYATRHIEKWNFRIFIWNMFNHSSPYLLVVIFGVLLLLLVPVFSILAHVASSTVLPHCCSNSNLSLCLFNTLRSK